MSVFKKLQEAYKKACNKEDISVDEEGLKDACWKGYEAIGTKKKNGREVPNCVPVKEESLDEESRSESGALFKDLVDKAHASSKAGNHTQAKRHLANAQTARYGILSKHYAKHQASFDKYKELKHSYTNSDEHVREAVDLKDVPFDPDPPKKNRSAKAGKYGIGHSIAKHLAKQALKKLTKEGDTNENFASDAQRKAVWASKNEKGVKEEVELDEEFHVVANKSYYGDKSTPVKLSSHKTKDEADAGLKKHMNEDISIDEAVQSHKVGVTVSDPNHQAVSQRKDKIQKSVIVKATDKGEAQAKAEAFYKKKGYKVHDSFHHSVVPATSMKTEAYKLPSDSDIDKVKAHVKANHPNKSLAQVAVHKQTKKIEYVVKDKDGKMSGHTLGEEAEQIDELSNKLLNRYSKKAEKDAGKNFMAADRAQDKGKYDKAQAHMDKADKRASGVYKAQSKIKEDFELDESRGHKILATALGNMDRMKNVQIPTPAERKAELEKQKLTKKEEAVLSFDDFMKEQKTCSYKKEELHPNQKKLDKNKNGKLDAHDFKLLRKEESELDEDAVQDYRDKKRSEREAEHAKQDPKHSVRYAKNMVDVDKAAKKAKERGIKKDAMDFDWKVRNGVQRGNLPEEVEEIDEKAAAGDWHVHDSKSGKIHSTYDSHRKAMNAMKKLNSQHDGYETPGGITQSKFSASAASYHKEDINESAWGKDKMSSLRQAHDRHMEKALAANKAGDDTAVKTHQRKMQMIQGKMQKLKQNEEVELGEECEILLGEATNTDVAAVRAEYKKNESDNKHTENAALLAKHFGSKSDQNKVAKAKAYRDKNGGYGGDVEGRHHSNLAYEVHKKLYQHIKEEAEELDELDKKTLGSYVKKSHDQLMKHTGSVNMKFGRGDKDAVAYSLDKTALRKTANRTKGMDQAISKLTKEDNEMLTFKELLENISESKIDDLKDKLAAQREKRLNAYDFSKEKDKKSNVTKVKGHSYGAGEEEGEDDDDTQKLSKPAKPEVKRGRGRPTGSKSGARN